ncbi:hypothetical protein F7725_025961, partial [Dissostichus mawsoni]
AETIHLRNVIREWCTFPSWPYNPVNKRLSQEEQTPPMAASLLLQGTLVFELHPNKHIAEHTGSLSSLSLGHHGSHSGPKLPEAAGLVHRPRPEPQHEHILNLKTEDGDILLDYSKNLITEEVMKMWSIW